MLVLAIDTSTDWCSVAVGGDAHWIVREEPAGQAHSERILTLCDEALHAAGVRLGALDGIAFGAGPGSFTGVRIACGIAQGLALADELPVVPVSTLEALAQTAWVIHGWRQVVACLDARMREVYVASYAKGEDGWDEIASPVVRAPEAVGAAPGPDYRGAGNGFAAYPGLGRQLGLATCEPTIRPAAQSVGELAQRRLAAGEAVAATDARPVYVRHRVALTTAERDAGLRL